MEIKISYQGKEIPAALESGERLTLYSVPESYSSDGLYLGRWLAHELEPVPACDSAMLLLELSLGNTGTGEGLALNEIQKMEGVEYAVS